MSTENYIKTEQEVSVKLNDLHPGEMLRKRREELGLSQQDIAQRLRLKLSIIESVETNHFDSHQVATFIRGYFRSYAKLVGIPEKEIVAALEQSGGGKYKEHAMHSFSQKNKLKKHDSNIMKLTWGILIIIIGISSVWWWQNHQGDTLTPSLFSQNSDTKESTSDENVSVDDVNPMNDGALTQTSSQQSGEDQGKNTQTVAAEQSTTSQQNEVNGTEPKVLTGFKPQSPSQIPIESLTSTTTIDDSQVDNKAEKKVDTPPTSGTQKTLNMVFTADCWIQVKDNLGNIISTGLKRAGETLSVDGSTPLSIILGAPEGVTMTLNNEPVDLSKFSSGKVARFKLP